ncbi:hypothetical protein [Actinoplanes sp. TFC3]|uniref:hypothetical protein n=1 Tax=Actinoplanes sp. TFC3 TaxID=1710355 RepID=UPI0008352A8C|nr:hypothetical protein [Actinoplanes sp. TFC3]
MNGTVTIVVALCVVSAFGYALGALLQQRVGDLPVRELMRTPHWWLAMGSNGLGALLHVAALRFGPLVLVQALGVLTLVLAVPLAALMRSAGARSGSLPGDAAAAGAQGRIGRRERVAALLTAAGLIGLLTLSGSAGGSALSNRDLITVMVIAAATLTLAAAHARGLTAAAAGGIAFGSASALTQTMTVRPQVLLLTTPAVTALTIAGVLFTQRSYRHSLAAPLAVGTVANPLAAAAIGVVLLGEHFRGGNAGFMVAMACALATAAGVWLLTSARPAVASMTDALGSAYRDHVVRAGRTLRRRRVTTRPAGRGSRTAPEPLPH